MYEHGTAHFNLPQTVGTDKRDWLDTNQAFADVDATLYTASETASSTASALSGLSQTVAGIQEDVTDIQQDVSEIDGRVTQQGSAITGLTTRIDNVKADALDMICAVDEGTAQVATVAVTAGKYFRYNDVLYMATSNINIGDSIIPNTNCRATNVAIELESLEGDSSLPTRVTTLEGKVSTLETKVDALENNELGTAVNLTATDYPAPSDGYVTVTAETGTGDFVHISINGTKLLYGNANQRYGILFVKKGMVLKVASSGGTYTAQFIPFE